MTPDLTPRQFLAIPQERLRCSHSQEDSLERRGPRLSVIERTELPPVDREEREPRPRKAGLQDPEKPHKAFLQ